MNCSEQIVFLQTGNSVFGTSRHALTPPADPVRSKVLIYLNGQNHHSFKIKKKEYR